MKLNKSTWIMTGAVVVIGSFGFLVQSHADSNSPGSIDDPVVTKSYVDQAVQQKVQEALAKQGAVTPTPAPSSTPAPSGSDTSAKLEVVVLKPGQTLLAGSGTEFIVRTGKTLAVSKTEDGIPDVTAGQDIPAGQAIETNHLLIFPRDDGRGIQPASTQKDDVYVMVRGNYLVVNP